MSVPPEFLSQLIAAHAATLELYARQICDTPEDAVQDAFVRLAAQSQLPSRVLPWLFEVTRNRAVSLQRSTRRRKRHEAQAARRDWFETNEGAPLDADMATRALEQLSSEEREVIVAHVWGGMTFDEIGRLTQTSSSTAHRRYREALARLRTKLGVTWLSITT
jgi:RNA polymerase sigma factor (sigma-70 family)